MLSKKEKKSGKTLKYVMSATLIGLFVCAIFMATIPASPDSLIIVSTLGTTVSGLGTPNLIEGNRYGDHGDHGNAEKIEPENTENIELEDTEEIEPESTENTENNESKNAEVIEDNELEDTEEIEPENTENNESVNIEETEPEEPIGMDELLANAFNCSEDIIFAADSSYSLITKKFLMEFIEKNDKNEEPRMPEIHDCDNFAMEFLMEIDAECAFYGIVPGVGVIWVEENNAEEGDEGHAVNFWINSTDKSIWAFDPQTDEEYSLEDQTIVFVYI